MAKKDSLSLSNHQAAHTSPVIGEAPSGVMTVNRHGNTEFFALDGELFVNAKAATSWYGESFDCSAGQIIVAKPDHGWACQDQPMTVQSAILIGACIIAAALVVLFALPLPKSRRK